MTHTFVRTVGQSDVRIAIAGPDDARQHLLESWSLAPLQKHCAPGMRNLQERLTHAVGRTLRTLGVRAAYAPHVSSASARIVESRQLRECVPLGGDVRLYRQHNLEADGVFLEEDETFVMSAAGCPVIIAAGGDHFVAAHAARDSLIDRLFVSGVRSRAFTSVVDCIVNRFRARGISPQDISMTMHFSIAPDRFEHSDAHPIHGAYNRALITVANMQWPGSIIRKNGSTYLNLEQVFVGQARIAGVRKVWVENTLNFFPHLVQTSVGKDRGKRNLIVVRRAS